MRPQWEGELELNPTSDCDNVHDVVDRDLRDYTSVIRECSLWILIRDSLSHPHPDILYQRIAGKGWNNSKTYGKFVALWFFLMTKKKRPLPTPRVAQLVFHLPTKFLRPILLWKITTTQLRFSR